MREVDFKHTFLFLDYYSVEDLEKSAARAEDEHGFDPDFLRIARLIIGDPNLLSLLESDQAKEWLIKHEIRKRATDYLQTQRDDDEQTESQMQYEAIMKSEAMVEMAVVNWLRESHPDDEIAQIGSIPNIVRSPKNGTMIGYEVKAAEGLHKYSEYINGDFA